MNWINRFALLGSEFSQEVQPTPVPQPAWVSRNFDLGQEMALPDDWLVGSEGVEVFAGNGLWEGMSPRATVYSGHQFGQWAGQLGDGRALYLGELETPTGRFEIQLKGAGLTPYSRMGDGRAVLRSSIREYLCSEAMHGLGIPTTRALCLTTSPQRVIREEIETAAIVTRIAPSFIRFGHFEHFANQTKPEARDSLRRLADHCLEHHIQTDTGFSANPYANLLHAVTLKTAELMAQWQSVGFCHGVMNTDNMSILGLSLDYGPFQFMDGFDPQHICNHSDHQGRYAYERQPQVAYWNLFCLAQALMPLIEEQELAMKALETYKSAFSEHWLQKFSAKLGLTAAGGQASQDKDKHLIQETLELLTNERTDFTAFWRRLSDAAAFDQLDHVAWKRVAELFIDTTAFKQWQSHYAARLSAEDRFSCASRMHQVNPKYVLRNHLAEAAIQKSKQGDHSEVETLLKLLRHPFAEQAEFEHYANLPPEWASSIEISCSS